MKKAIYEVMDQDELVVYVGSCIQDVTKHYIAQKKLLKEYGRYIKISVKFEENKIRN